MLRALRSVLLGLSLLTPLATSAPALAADDAIEAFRPSGAATFDHSAFDAILATHVKPDGEGYNQVDYVGLQADHAALDDYIAALEAATPSDMSADEAHAFWINLYNAKTLDVVLDAYPVESIRRINLGGALFRPGPWRKEIMEVEGVALTLDDVEHRIVRALFEDPMSHYALNCASYSCPNLAASAYTADNLNAMMEESGRLYVNHPRGVDVRGDRITASKIYDWYAEDFGGEDALKAHWISLAEPDKGAAIEAAEIGRYRYDWDLNDIEREGS